ncbi:hypothetical protein L486_08504 [Kwoniella mangroviensis CBS 10435]|uniref:Uncharacterized protein n=1 Tax=Kwoniella mangroviensis CBS 10435 TaxID=1331196 RepID=A0A1B9IEW2_9TREE|nr:hypothetical protein L486_08504 [Kwoniella mangroviensis CBS 10435]
MASSSPFFNQSSDSPKSSPSSYRSKASRPITFTSLSELHPLILFHLKIISPLTLLPVNRALYTELLPTIYKSVKLNRHNANGLFYGYSALSNSFYRNKRSRYLSDFPLKGRRSRSSPPDVIPQQNDRFRKSKALSLTEKVILEDAESLSVICQVHMELLSYSPTVPLSRRKTIQDHDYYYDVDLDHSHGNGQNLGHSSNSTTEHPWPLNNVDVLEVGYELLEYLVDCHSPTPTMGKGKGKSRERLPICCIPFTPKVLIINLRPLPISDGNARRIEGKRYLRLAISELASEFDGLEKLILRFDLDHLNEGNHEAVQIHDRQEEETEGEPEIYIPPVENPLPAPEIVVVLSSHPSLKANENARMASHEDQTTRYTRAVVNFLEDTGRRSLILPNIQIASPTGQIHEIRDSVKRIVDGGYPQSVGKRVLERTKFVGLDTTRFY